MTSVTLNDSVQVFWRGWTRTQRTEILTTESATSHSRIRAVTATTPLDDCNAANIQHLVPVFHAVERSDTACSNLNLACQPRSITHPSDVWPQRSCLVWRVVCVELGLFLSIHRIETLIWHSLEFSCRSLQFRLSRGSISIRTLFRLSWWFQHCCDRSPGPGRQGRAILVSTSAARQQSNHLL